MKTAAIWWRVSTDDQKEISPDTQTGAALALAEQESYQVPPAHIIGADWGSLSVWDSPPMDRLKALIRDRAIEAVIMYDSDRGPSKPVHRLLFRALCEDNGVAVRCCHGEIPGGEMGEVMEFLSAWAKEKQVHRTQQGAKDGLRDRARVKGLPVNGKVPYGYRLNYQDNKPTAYEPDSATYHIASRVWQACLDGHAIRRICRELMADGVPSPKGRTAWAPSTVFGMLTNPIYGGRYYALRREAMAPRQRRGDTYGKSSSALRPLDDAIQVEFPVHSPIVSWAEWETVQKRLLQNKLQSKRNSGRVYLLSGMVSCADDGRHLQPYSPKGSWYYACSRRRGNAMGIESCTLGHINGPQLEAAVWDHVVEFLNDPQVFMAEVASRRGSSTESRADIEKVITALRQKIQKVDGMETELVALQVRGIVSDTAIERNAALLKAERTFYLDEIERQEAELATAMAAQEAVEALVDIRERVRDKLEASTAEERRWVLQALETRVKVSQGNVEVSIGVPKQLVDSVQQTKVLRLASSM